MNNHYWFGILLCVMSFIINTTFVTDAQSYIFGLISGVQLVVICVGIVRKYYSHKGILDRYYHDP